MMKEIKKVKLGVNKDAIVVVSSDVEMKSKEDADEAYIIMFNIIGDPYSFTAESSALCLFLTPISFTPV